jgi:hypothetical protein
VTIRQRKALKLVEKGRSMKEVMVEAGYSPATATHPTKLTKSKGWNELLEKRLPDEELLKVTKDALKAEKLVALPDEPNVVMPDYAIRLKASEQGYKLKGRFQPDVQVNTQNNFIGDDQLNRIIGD